VRDDDVSNESNTCFTAKEETEKLSCEEGNVSKDAPKMNNTYLPEENDPTFLAQIFDDDGWNSDNFDRMDGTAHLHLSELNRRIM
jgi:hypothetical protein